MYINGETEKVQYIIEKHAKLSLKFSKKNCSIFPKISPILNEISRAYEKWLSGLMYQNM